jgi:hypothetical protein
MVLLLGSAAVLGGCSDGRDTLPGRGRPLLARLCIDSDRGEDAVRRSTQTVAIFCTDDFFFAGSAILNIDGSDATQIAAHFHHQPRNCQLLTTTKTIFAAQVSCRSIGSSSTAMPPCRSRAGRPDYDTARFLKSPISHFRLSWSSTSHLLPVAFVSVPQIRVGKSCQMLHHQRGQSATRWRLSCSTHWVLRPAKLEGRGEGDRVDRLTVSLRVRNRSGIEGSDRDSK